MKKKTVELLQRIAITATTVVYGVSFTGNLIALKTPMPSTAHWVPHPRS